LSLRIRSLALVIVVLAVVPAGALAAETGGAATGGAPAGGARVEAPPAATPATPSRAGARAAGGASAGQRMLARGARGPAVRRLQQLLTRAGLPTPVVGIFGPQTERNVRAFQRRAGMRADGIAGPRTLAALRRAPVAAAPAAPPVDPAPATPPAPGPTSVATLRPDGTASPPADAPPAVAAAIAAGNRIASLPYKWGGGHRTWEDSGYDCSGSVGYALHGGGLLDATSDSTGFMSYGEPGPGRWITIYANAGHVYMVVAGLRFDTSGAKPSRWQAELRSTDGYAVRHPAGL
jgi:peptidoglycan hydrolase-like protein with peptidoglycan-binding domain